MLVIGHSAVENAQWQFQQADPVWLGMRPASEVIPGMDRKRILKSGPPLPWEKLCDTQKQGILNGILFEEWAKTPEEALRMILDGDVDFAAGNDHHAVCSGAGITTPSMLVNVVCDHNSGALGFCAPFEGPNRGGLGGWGTLSPAIAQYLRFMKKQLQDIFSILLEDGISLRPILSAGFSMGDEMHSCQDGASALIINELLSRIIRSGLSRPQQLAVTEFLTSTRRFFHPLDMAAAMAVTLPLRGIADSPIVTAMVGNGVEFGIKIGACGDRWFTAPSPVVTGVPIKESPLPWIGDSSMTETAGWGGMASGASASAAYGLGKNLQELSPISDEMAKITIFRNPHYRLAGNNGAGSPCGIDIRKVVETGICPVLHGGRISPSGERLGAGCTQVPLECFQKAFSAWREIVQKRG